MKCFACIRPVQYNYSICFPCSFSQQEIILCDTVMEKCVGIDLTSQLVLLLGLAVVHTSCLELYS